MKIGILTFPTAINYGTALQAAALRKVLTDNGHDVRFLDHRCQLIDSTNKVFDLRCVLDLKYTLAHLYNLPVALKRTKRFTAFQQKFIPLAPDDPTAFDAVVAGSDQIWNYQLTDCDYYYFLDYNKCGLKVSYAGSFGLSEIDDDKRERIATLLSDFDYLSVREQQAATIVKNIAGLDVPVVCDPTLLLQKSEWSALIGDKPKNTGYIFVYTVFNSEEIWAAAQQLSKETGLPVKTISYSKLHRHDAIYDFTAGPDDWVNYMLNADYVVTNSFHGVAFSINFRKNFFFAMPPAKAGVGSRISDITARYGLSNRNLLNEDFTLTTAAPDFSQTDRLLDEDRRASLDFIDLFLK